MSVDSFVHDMRKESISFDVVVQLHDDVEAAVQWLVTWWYIFQVMSAFIIQTSHGLSTLRLVQ